tara:strand:- start:637 stop:1212 length:576 start_codon:yes stop_codon:yes gene_type:complete
MVNLSPLCKVDCNSNFTDDIYNTCNIDCSSSIFNLKTTEAKIQNQVGVSQSQMLSVLSSFNIRQIQNSTGETNITTSSRIFGSKYNLRNQSDRIRVSSNTSNNVVSRGNSVKRSVTSNRPGSMAPGGFGVDVKHGSYSRYLGKIKANNIKENDAGTREDININMARQRPAMNNKNFTFSIINTRKCNNCPR